MLIIQEVGIAFVYYDNTGTFAVVVLSRNPFIDDINRMLLVGLVALVLLSSGVLYLISRLYAWRVFNRIDMDYQAEKMFVNNASHEINSVISFTFVIGCFLAAIGSLLYFSNYTTVVPTSGAMPGLKAFVAAVFGGIGSIPGAVVGAFLIGLCEEIIKGLGQSTFSDAFTFALLIIVLCVKPTGLFGEKVTDKV